jgi:hypothetical protein
MLENEQLIKTKEEIQKRYETYYNKWRDYDLLTSLLSILGLVVAIIDVKTIYLHLNRNSMSTAWLIISTTLNRIQKTLMSASSSL